MEKKDKTIIKVEEFIGSFGEECIFLLAEAGESKYFEAIEKGTREELLEARYMYELGKALRHLENVVDDRMTELERLYGSE